jgi:hypothetical protein
MPAYETNANGSIRAFTAEEIAEIDIKTLGVRDGSHPTERREVNASTVEAEYDIEPLMLDRFCMFMLGYQLVYEDSGTDYISRLPPQTWPRTDLADGEAFAAVKLTHVNGHKILNDNTLDREFPIPEYKRTTVGVLFQHVPFAVKADDDTLDETERYVQTLPSQHEVSYLTLPGGVMQYRTAGAASPDGKQIPFNIGFPIPQSTISRRWIRLPYDAWGPGTVLFDRVNGDQATGEKSYVGSVNVNAFLGYPAGHLLYLGPEEELQLDPTGAGYSWNLTHKWLAKYQAPHTWFYHHPTAAADAAEAGWYYASKAGSPHRTVATMLDDESLFHARAHEDLFTVDG